MVLEVEDVEQLCLEEEKKLAVCRTAEERPATPAPECKEKEQVETVLKKEKIAS